MKHHTIRFLGLGVLAVLLAACGGGGSGSGNAGGASLPAVQTGTVTLTLSDAPIHEYQSILMTIDEIRFIASGGQDILVLEDPVEVDFLQLQNFSEVLLRREVAVGTYSKIRLILSKLTVVEADGTENDVPLNGLRKVDINPRGPFTVRAGQDLVIDLDLFLDKSIHIVKTGANERLRFRPVIFAGISAEGPLRKIFRIEGRVDSIGTPAGMFRVCDIRRAFADDVNRPQPADICITVDPGAGTPYFDESANPIATSGDGLGQLMLNDPVVVYGQFDYDAAIAADPEAGDPMIPAAIAVGLNFSGAKGVADSEYRPDAADFDLGPASADCAIDPDALRVEVATGAPAFEERPATVDADPAVEAIPDLAAIAMLCRRAEVEGHLDETGDPFLRTFIVLLGESPLGNIELVGALTEKAATAEVTDDYDMAVVDEPSASDPTANDEIVVVPAETPMFRVTSGADGDAVVPLTAVPVGTEVTVYGSRRDDDVIEATFILEEATAPGAQ